VGFDASLEARRHPDVPPADISSAGEADYADPPPTTMKSYFSSIAWI
jgi:hypothetical protein